VIYGDGNVVVLAADINSSVKVVFSGPVYLNKSNPPMGDPRGAAQMLPGIIDCMPNW
jgi:hypothetical protein